MPGYADCYAETGAITRYCHAAYAMMPLSPFDYAHTSLRRRHVIAFAALFFMSPGHDIFTFFAAIFFATYAGHARLPLPFADVRVACLFSPYVLR